MFGSPAVFVTTMGVIPLIVRSVCAGNTGATFTSSHRHHKAVRRAQTPVTYHRREQVRARTLRLAAVST